MCINYLEEKEKKKAKSQRKTQLWNPGELSTKSSSTWFPSWFSIHVSLQSCKNFFLRQLFCLGRNLRGQKMKFVLSVPPDILGMWKKIDNRSSGLTTREELITTLWGRSCIPPCCICFTSLIQERRNSWRLASAAKVAPCTCSPAWFEGHLEGRAKSQREIGNSPDAVLYWHVRSNESANRGPVDGAQDCSKILGFVRVHFKWFSLHSSFSPHLIQPPPIPTRLSIGLLRAPRL